MAEEHVSAEPARRVFGARVRRIEDPALLRGRGRFVDDIQLPDMVHAAFVRSPHAHAAISGIATEAARARPGIHAVFVLADLAPHLTSPRLPVAMPSAALRRDVDPWVLAGDEVRYVGEPVAVVVADDPYLAEDAAAALEIDYRPLPAAVDCRAALAPDAPAVHCGTEDNVVAQFTLAYGDCGTAFAAAPHVFRETLFQHKGLGHAIECRGIVARHDPVDDVLTVWSGTQMAHRARDILTVLLGCGDDHVRVIAPDVGGGFGPKFVFYAEDAVVPLAAKLLGRPVKWIEDRREHFVAATQERDQYWDVEAAADEDGRLIGVRGTMIHDHGAYTPYGVNLPYNSATNLLGPYVLPNYELSVTVALTNKVPVTPVRGAGRPQGTFVMERLLDRIARELGLDRAEVRRRNMIAAERMPYTTPVVTRDGAAMTYDSGDYPACMAAALERADYDGFARRQAAARKDGRYLGIGLANYVEGTGRGPFESATVRVGGSGRVSVHTGATAQGQGTRTTLAQICAEQLGVAVDDIEIVAGDTAATPLGLGAFASRQAVTAGSSVHLAAVAVRDKAFKAAAQMLEASADDLEAHAGEIRVRGVPALAIGLGEIARALAGVPGYALPAGVEPGLEASANFMPETLTYCNGTHVVEVEIDPETGEVDIVAYTAVHDSGRLINPTIVDGQVAGGIAHGIGNALFERMRFDPSGQPMTTNFGDYLLPVAAQIPRLAIVHMESPTPLNPLGVKGAGEGGTIPAPAAVASAVEDALAPLGVRIAEVPILPARIVELIAEAKGGRSA